jgi:hypothetical protein
MESRVMVAVTLASVVLAGSAIAQSPQVRVVAGGGSATDIRGVRSAAYMLAPSLLLFPGRESLIALTGRATRFTTGEWALGGGLTLQGREQLLGPLSLTSLGGADYTHTSYDVRYLTLEATPALELLLGPATLFGGARTALARITIEDPGLEPLGGLNGTTDTRTSAGPVFGAGFRVASFGPGEGAVVQYREERARVESVRVIDRFGSARVVAGPVVVTGSFGHRDAPDERTTFGGVQVTVALTPMLAVVGGLDEYPSNRLTGALGGRTVSAALMLRLGGRSSGGRLPRPAGVEDPEPGFTRLSIRAPDAQRVEVAGDWNDWKPQPACRASNGVWYADLRLAPGDYRYAFRIDGTRWAVPNGVPAVDDGFGGKSAWVTVRGPTRTQHFNQEGE